MAVHQLSRAQARRIAVCAQLLDSPRPTNLLDVVRHLTFIQIDPTEAVARSADLVAWSRLGSSYSPAELEAALEKHSLVELRAMIRPSEDIALYRAGMAAWCTVGEPLRPWEQLRADWVRTNDKCRRDILGQLAERGPLPSRDLPDTCVEPWASTGWTNNRNVTQMLEFMTSRGEVAISGRRGRERLWDLADRVYPADPVLPAVGARRIRDERRLRALGIARAVRLETPAEQMDVVGVGEQASVERIKGTWRVDPYWLDRRFSGRAALLSPFDQLIHDRKRALELFGYDYLLEMYKPAARRRWGYYALPILYEDRLVGKLDATADRKSGVLRVDAIHQDCEFTKTTTSAVQREIEDLARWLELDVRLPA